MSFSPIVIFWDAQLYDFLRVSVLCTNYAHFEFLLSSVTMSTCPQLSGFCYPPRGKVMFSLACVCPRWGVGYDWSHVLSRPLVPCPFWGRVYLVPGSFQIPRPMSLLGIPYPQKGPGTRDTLPPEGTWGRDLEGGRVYSGSRVCLGVEYTWEDIPDTCPPREWRPSRRSVRIRLERFLVKY